MKSQISLPALMLLLAASGAAAQVMYKSTMPDGRVIYGEKPAPGAQRVETITPPPPATGTMIVTPADKARADQTARQRAAATDAARRELDEAQRQLQEAEAARDAGKEPLPGERLGTVGGASRLTDAYWERQKRLEQAVDAAHARLKKAEEAGR